MNQEHNRRSWMANAGAGTVGLGMLGAARTKPSFAGQRNRKIRVGQIGVAHAHANKLEVYRESDDYEVVGVVESNSDLRRAAMQRTPFQDLNWMTQEELLGTKDLDAVLVETEIRQLLPTAEACIDAGLHVHLDKPAGESLSDYKRLLDKAGKQNLLVQMGYMYRYNPAVLQLRELLDAGMLGEIFEIETTMSKVVAPASRQELAQYPGGILFELGCHILDLTIGVLGRPDEVNGFQTRVLPTQDALTDNMLAVLRYPKAIATVKSTAVEVEGFARRHFTVCGTKGTYHIQPLDNPTALLALQKAVGGYQKGYQELKFPRYRRYVDDAADMARIIRGEKDADYSYEHDFTVQSTLLKACGMPV